MGNAIIVEPYDLVAVTADGSAAGTTPANLNNDWMGVVHRGTATATGSVSADLGVARTVDTLALLSCRPSASTLVVLGGTSSGSGDLYNSGFVPFPAGGTVPVNGREHSLHLLTSPALARYWYCDISPLGGTPFEAGRWVIGRRLQLARNFSFGAAFGVRDGGGGEFNAQGVWLPKSGAKLRTLGISFTRATRQEAEEQLQPLLERIGNGKHILVVTDPDANVLRQRRMYFGPLTGALETLWEVPQGFQWRANLVSSI